MNTSDITLIEKQITALEKQLSALHSQRLAVLEQQVREAQSRIQALTGTTRRISSPAESPSARAATPTQPTTARVAPRVARVKSVKVGAKKKRTRMPSDLVNDKIMNTIKEANSEGLSQKEISVRSGVNYQTTAKKLRELPGIVKKGSGKEARYTFKG
ncbi:MAG: hypothetical protein DVB23_000427 [Verrucomicrobia bacterium]|nr:MAG: hypothetical protein DVB23_000427 [Verrucomicrobiota bacterium]